MDHSDERVFFKSRVQIGISAERLNRVLQKDT